MRKGYCFWCGDPLKNRAFRRYIGTDEEGNNLYECFCDNACLISFEVNTRIENDMGVDDTINNVKINKNDYKAKRCTTCGRGGKAKDFSCKVSLNVNRGNNSGQKYYCCNKGCLQKFIEKVASGEQKI